MRDGLEDAKRSHEELSPSTNDCLRLNPLVSESCLLAVDYTDAPNPTDVLAEKVTNTMII